MKRLVKMLLFIFAFTTFANAATMTYGYYRDYDYPYVYDAYWNYRTAMWSTRGAADKYEVVLYRDGRRIATRTTYSRSYNFSSDMYGRGCDYYFEVRPYNYRTGWGSWTSSNYTYFDDYCYYEYRHDRNYYRDGRDISYAVNQGPPYESQSYNSNGYSISNSGYPSLGNNTINFYQSNVQSVNVPEPQIVNDTINGIIPTGAFMNVFGVWKYAYINGAFATSTWVKSKGKWYYIDLNGNMVTGPYSINGKTYFLNSDGSMATGFVNVAGINHYFDANGVMQY